MRASPPVGPLDPLRIPLAGAQVIEASAGTGKTWTLASLYVRVVLGHGRGGEGLLPPRILVMTFTEAATAELRDRIRRRLGQAARVFRGQPLPGETLDPFLSALREDWPAERWPALALQLEVAAQWMDEAAIHTIHGWCHRTLRRHAFDSASLFDQDKAEGPLEMKRAAARDYWRHWVYPLDEARFAAVRSLARTPDALYSAVAPLIAARGRAPGAAPPAIDFDGTLAAWAAWNASCEAAAREVHVTWATHRASIESQLRAAMETELSGSVYRKDQRDAYLARIGAWSGQPFGLVEVPRDDLLRFGLDKLRRSTRKGRTTPQDTTGVHALIDAYGFRIDAEPPVTPILEHAAAEIIERYAQRKATLGQFDFDDLLQRLYAALHATDGRLAAVLREQYPVALVDEFQDTDPWQYGSLRRIYLDPDAGRSVGLVMIGDPKQAIYSFRGADLPTYLEARSAADGIHTLSGNHRSTAGLVRAVNHVFGSAATPFGDIRYEPVTACKPDVRPLADADGCEQPTMTAWYDGSGDALTGPRHRLLMAESFASRIVALVSDAVLRPADVAVLVRHGTEASAIRAALDRRGLRSVYLSDKESVFSSREASDLWHVLRAVAEPRVERHVRAALSCRVFGRELEELESTLGDELALDAEVERFLRWRTVWQRHGVLATIYAVLHDEGIPVRLLAQPDGERRLTNLLHLGDLLQEASLGLQGEVAIVRHLGARLGAAAAPTDDSGEDPARMRLETDADLVKVVTMHKSKGLQYPVVFVPFASSFHGEDDAERIAENLRLLYVAFTRAERALFVGVATLEGEFSDEGGDSASALGRLLGRRRPGDLAERLAEWRLCPDIRVEPLPAPEERRIGGAARSALWRGADAPLRRHASDWRSASFSSLTRGIESRARMPVAPTEQDERFDDAQVDHPPAPAVLPEVAAGAMWSDFPAGARYGDLLHGLLEWQVEQGWPLHRAEAAVAQWEALVCRRCDALQLDARAREILTPWIRAIGDCPLGAADTCLAALPRASCWPEMGFLLTTHGVEATSIDALVRAHVLPGQDRGPLQPTVLEGMLTGFLDLVFEHRGRYFVLDYKSNRLAGYAPSQLAEAILDHRYDLQYVLYLVALHRLLRSRLQDYDYDRHVGGALYLFVRGIGGPGHGLYEDRPPRVLIETIDSLLAVVPERRP